MTATTTEEQPDRGESGVARTIWVSFLASLVAGLVLLVVSSRSDGQELCKLKLIDENGNGHERPLTVELPDGTEICTDGSSIARVVEDFVGKTVYVRCPSGRCEVKPVVVQDPGQVQRETFTCDCDGERE